MRRETHRLMVNGLSHFVRDTGPVEGPIAILLHGFPDSGAMWDGVTPALTAAGFRIVAPDLRGFGETDMAARKAEYEINVGAAPDVLALCDAMEITRAHIVGHDFGAPVAWTLAAQHPQRFATLTALSVGHVRAYLRGGGEQLLKAWYVLLHQCRGVSEALYRADDWRLLRQHWSGHGDIEAAISNLARPGRLTAALDWYRANISLGRMIRQPRFGAFGEEIVRIPTLGVWSDGDRYLSERQMTRSSDYVDAPWVYKRIDNAGHWIALDAPDRLAELLVDHWRSYSVT